MKKQAKNQSRAQSQQRWPSVAYETLPWERSPDEFDYIPKSKRRHIKQTFEAAIPAYIASCDFQLSQEMQLRISDVLVSLARFDAKQISSSFNLPSILLRSESAASSQIENLTSSAKNVALADLSDKAPGNARIIAGNVLAMRKALELPDEINSENICKIHQALLETMNPSFAGHLRHEQVWIGGTPYSPHEALFVPPQYKRVPSLLEDLTSFSQREDINPIAKAAILHAQFETIHPFVDGNGRTGRTLVHKVLRAEGVLINSTLPVSAGLLHNVDAYMDSLASYQSGDPFAVIEQLLDALETSLFIGECALVQIQSILDEWKMRITEREGSGIHKLPELLAEQPVVDTAYAAKHLDISRRAASSLLNRACEYKILRPLGKRSRGEFYQAQELTDVLDDISSKDAIKRLRAKAR